MPFLHFFRIFLEVLLAAILRHAFSIIHIYKLLTIFFIKKLHICAYMRAYLILKEKARCSSPGPQLTKNFIDYFAGSSIISRILLIVVSETLHLVFKYSSVDC